MLNEREKTLLESIRFGLREVLPEEIAARERSAIFKAIEYDRQFELGIFSKDDIFAIVSETKETYLNHHPDVKCQIKKMGKR